MGIKVTVPPAVEPLTLDEAKAQCHVESTVHDEDALITAYIVAARRWCENFDWRAYITRTIELWLDAWPSDGTIELPRPPLQSVSKVEYYDTADVKATLATSVYAVDAISEPGKIWLAYQQTWPTTTLREHNGICVTYVAGYGLAANVPEDIKNALRLLVGHWYENREEVTVGAVARSIEFGVKALLGIDRAFRF